ncbi:hypothetical protein SAMN05661044_04609 [Olivibacter domesticus]|uniref:Uncharacterized protein n=1 Tax=Olivibacter domesticus TaxID=407022 RepID=A0A1H7WQ88_OLID1|nr:hypothetical protein SAMN05661044_04609 [Olivibacter domesticus]
MEEFRFNVINFLILISPLLLGITYILTKKEKTFPLIFAIHIGMFVIYMTFLYYYAELLAGHDEYGLEKVGLYILFIVSHIYIGFFYGVYLAYRRRK